MARADVCAPGGAGLQLGLSRTDDVDGDAVGVDNPNLVDGDDDELGDDIDLGSLGFDQ